MNPNDFTLFQVNSEQLNSVILAPIIKYSRVSYTSFTVSNELIVFGSSSGGLYIFKKDEDKVEYLCNIPSNEGKITCMSFASHNDSIIAYATSKGALMIIDLNILEEESGRTMCWKTIYSARNFSSSIDQLKWDPFSDRLFICEKRGTVFLVNKIKSLTSLLVPQHPIAIIKLDHPIFQIDYFDGLLAISSASRAIFFNLLESSISQIGTKSRPFGEYGIVFFPYETSHFIYTSRPGSRIWKADLNGNVHATHQFKSSINQTSLAHIINGLHIPSSIVPPNFEKLYRIPSTHTLLAQSSDPSCLFFMNLSHDNSLLWTNSFTDIIEIATLKNEVYILYNDNEDNRQKMAKIKILTRKESFQQLINCKDYKQASKLVLSDKEYFKTVLKNDNFLRNIAMIMYEKVVGEEKKALDEIMTEIMIKQENSDDADKFDKQLKNEYIIDNNFKQTNGICLTEIETPEISDNNVILSIKKREEKQIKENKEKLIENSNENKDICNIHIKFREKVNQDTNNNTMINDDAKNNNSNNINNIDNSDNKKNNNGDGDNYNNNVYDYDEDNVQNDNNDSNKNENENENNYFYHNDDDHHHNGDDGKNDDNGGDNDDDDEDDNNNNDDDEDKSDKNKNIEKNKMEISKNNYKIKDFERMKLYDYFSCNLNIMDYTKTAKCFCGYPKPKSHHKYSDIKIIVDVIINKFDNISKYNDLFYQFAFWPLYCEILLKLKKYNNYIKMCLALQDLSLLNNEEIEIYLDNIGWKHLFYEYHEFIRNSDNNSFNCLNCKKEKYPLIITWDMFIKYILKYMKAEEVFHLIETHQNTLSESMITPSLCLSLIASHAISVYHNSFTHKKLSQLNEILGHNRGN